MRHGGLGLRQLGVAAAHCKLDSKVANFMKVLCGQEIYRWFSQCEDQLIVFFYGLI